MILKILLIFSLLITSVYAQEVIAEFDESGKTVLNEELDSISRKLIKIKRTTQDRVLVWYIPNVLTAGTNKSGRLDLPFSGTVIKATAYCKTAPTGAALIFDINKNGTSIWATTQANRITIAATETTGSQTSFDTTAVDADDYFTIDIDQVGSTVAGSDATVQLIVRESIND